MSGAASASIFSQTGCGAGGAAAGMSEAILKLVFLRDVPRGGNTPARRKAVVPLTEGIDFENFIARVRLRLGLPDGLEICLRDEHEHTHITSIDGLLEVDESTTLEVSYLLDKVPAAGAVGGTDGCASASRQRPVARQPLTPSAGLLIIRVAVSWAHGTDSFSCVGLDQGALWCEGPNRLLRRHVHY